MATRTSRINALRGLCREFGVTVSQGARLGLEQIARVLADPGSPVPELIRGTLKLLVEEVRLLEARIGQLERELSALARQSPACTTLLTSRHLGRISKRGDRYLRMLLTHGARSVLRAATLAARRGQDLDGLRRWALSVQGRSNHNKATCALANKMARICYATLRDAAPYGQPSPRPRKKLERETFALPA